MKTTRPENQLLLYAARLSLDDAEAGELQQLFHADLDWEYLHSQADRHSILPLLHHHLSSFHQAVPAAVLARIRNVVRTSTERGIFLSGELIKLLDIFEAHQIEAVPFKGPTLAAMAYGDVGLREFADLDILVRKEDLGRVKELLAGRGITPAPALTNSQEAALRRFECAHNFGDESRVLFDVHWDFAAPYFSYSFPLERMWKRRQTVTIGGRKLRTLSSEDLLLVLCLHGATHQWERLGWIADVAALVKREVNLDWQQVMTDAAESGNTRMLLLGLTLANELLGTKLPEFVMKQIEDDEIVQKLSERVQSNLFVEEPASPGALDEIRFQLRLKERRAARFKAGVRLAFTPRSYDWMGLALPESLVFLHYLWRPLRLAGRQGSKLFTPARLNGE